MTLSVRGRCGVCKRRRRVRRDGNIRIHYENEMMENADTRGSMCPGSEKLPLESSGAKPHYFCNTGCSGCSDMIEYGI